MLRTETKQCDKRDVDVPTFRVACHIVTVTAIEQYHVRLHALNTRKTHLCTVRFCLLKKSLINQSQYSVVCFDEVNVGLLPLVNNEPCANSFFSVSAHIVDLPWPRTHSTVYCHEYNYLLKTDKHVHINIKLQYLEDVS